MAKPMVIELSNGGIIPIIYEDRVVLAIDKPAGWMLAPDDWDRTGRNLQRALISSINGGDFWAVSRQLRFIRFIHRIDAETTGIVLFAKTPGAVKPMTELFESRRVEKKYLAVVDGKPAQEHWTCTKAIGPVPGTPGRMKIDPRNGKEAETEFRVVQVKNNRALIEARPVTGRTHQIRVHLADMGLPVLGDALYGPARAGEASSMALRSVELSYPDPFQRRTIRICCDATQFLRQYGFAK